MKTGFVELFGSAACSSRINFSRLYAYESPKVSANAIGIKYVTSGQEAYEVNNRTLTVHPGHYLLIDQANAYSTFLSGGQQNVGLCMNIDPAITSDILFTLSRRDEVLLNGGDVDCASLDITEGLYRADDTALGACLSWLVAVAESEDPAKLNVETFYQVAETFVRSQRQVMELVRKVPLARPQVQKEIFKRLDTARDYMHSQFASSIAIEELAMVAGMSPFYFMRSFKKVFGVSAYQYLLNYRLQLAAQLVREHQLRLMDIAVATGFADEFALSKAFKKRFGHSPRSISFQHLQ